ncbi:hypothetical protein [Streptomyces minutiscleroticus]|uniref:hypothetical protein n=1 Tax=Streptomyces minutiscleroticus TaxID=68238 RepID=UPI003327C16E
MQVREWLPDQPTRIGRHDWPDEGDNGTHLRLRAGSIVVLDRQAWRVLEIDGYPGHQWPESYERAWRDHMELWWHANELLRANNQQVKAAPERSEFYKRPVVLVLRNENLPRSTPKHWCAPASHDWQVLPEHYAVCRACGELPPCRHGEYRWEGGPRRDGQSGGIPLIVPEGCCMGCAEPIKPRMRTVRFPGPNLWYPDLGQDTAVFHARAACADQVDCYRMQWRAEYAAPAPSLPPGTPAFPGFEQFTLPRTRHAPDLNQHVQQDPQPPQGPHSPQTAHVRQDPHRLQHPPQGRQPQPAAPARPAEEERTSVVSDYGTFYLPAGRYRRGGPESDAAPSAPAAAPFPFPPSSASPSGPAVPEPAHRTVSAASGSPLAEQAAPAGRTAPAHPAPAEAPAPARPHDSAPAHLVAVEAPAGGYDSAPARPHDSAPAPLAVAEAPAPCAGDEASAAPHPADSAAPMLKAAQELSLSLGERPVFHNAEQATRVIEELTAAVRNIALCLNQPPAREHP